MPRGRPKAFTVDAALQSAMHTFWERGYQATTLDDLTHAMQINRPSLYATFGDKEQLFLRAADLYASTYATRAAAALASAPDLREALTAFLQVVIDQLSNAALPLGCLRVNSTAAHGGASAAIQQKLRDQQTHLEAMLDARLRQAQADGQLGSDEDPQALANFFAGIVNGMVVAANAGRQADTFRQIAATALRVLPPAVGEAG